MELHIWCPLPGAPSLDPACLAAAWLASESGKDVRIMQSSATHLSPTPDLPLLIQDDDGQETVSGFVEIATALGYEISGEELAVLAYVQQLNALTQWSLFLLKENYEAVTRPEISSQIPFPMQYNAALAEQRRAQAAQALASGKAAAGGLGGLAGDKGQQVEECLNKLHRAMLEQNAERERAREIPKANMRRMMQLAEICTTLRDVHIRAGSVGEYLLSANLVLMTLAVLPMRPLEAQIEQDETLRQCRDRGRARNLRVVCTEVSPERQRSLWNVASVYTASIRSALSRARETARETERLEAEKTIS